MSRYEEEIYLIRRPFDNGHRCVMGTTDKDKAFNLIKYVAQAEDQGFTTFSSYKACIKIVSIIEDNLVLSLTSNDDFIRTIAESTKTVD